MYIDEIYNTGDETINFKETYIHGMIEDILLTYRHCKAKAQIHEFNEMAESMRLYTSEDALKSARELEEERAYIDAGAYAESKRKEVTDMINEWVDDMSDEDFKNWYIKKRLEDIRDNLQDVDSIEEAIDDLQELLELAYK